MIKNILTICTLLFITLSVSAQEKVTNKHSFKNGIYKSFKEFKTDQPSIPWSTVSSDLIVMESIHKAKMGNLIFSSDSNIVNIGNIWGFCINGIPYKRILDEEGDGFYIFAGLQLRGKICYYEYKMTKEVPVEISAYNPLTGKPFRTSTVMREKTIQHKIMLDFETGNSDVFALESVEKWIASDQKLLDTFNATPMDEKIKKLFKFIQIFNDRNAVVIGKRI